MSASREKNKRKELLASEQTQTAPVEKKGMSKCLKTTIGVVVAVIVLAAVVFFTMLTSGFFADRVTAATVGEHELTPAVVNYYYADAYSSYSQTYGDMVSYFFDPNTPLSSQVYDEETGKTWADFFMELGLESAAANYAIYDEAVASGFEMSGAARDELQTNLDLFDTYATMNGFANADAYIAAQFGAGCSKENFKEYMEVVLTAEEYAQKVTADFTYTAEEVAAEFEANKNNYTGVSYRTYFIPYSDYEAEGYEGETASEEAMAAAKAVADEMAAASKGNEAEYLTLCEANASEDTKANYVDDAYTLREDYNAQNVLAEGVDWLFDTARAEGDTTVIEVSGGLQVLYYISFHDHEENLVNVRHILLSVSDPSDEEMYQNAKETAESVLAEYEAGEQTEEAFAELAKLNSSDGNAADGGLYENVYPGQMVPAFNDWCFDESRQVGDVEIVETDYGFHVIYFSGVSDAIYHDYLAENTLRSNDFNTWYEGATKDVSYTTNAFGMRLSAA